MAMNQFFALIDQRDVLRVNAFFVLNLGLDVIDGVALLDRQIELRLVGHDCNLQLEVPLDE